MKRQREQQVQAEGNTERDDQETRRYFLAQRRKKREQDGRMKMMKDQGSERVVASFFSFLDGVRTGDREKVQEGRQEESKEKEGENR